MADGNSRDSDGSQQPLQQQQGQDQEDEQVEVGSSSDTTSIIMTEIEHPGKNDVMFGRGGDTNYHIGNHRFRMCADEYADRYQNASRKEKAIVVRELVTRWRRKIPPGRFLTRTDPSKGDESLWHDVGPNAAIKKAAKILSERCSERRAAAFHQDDNNNNSNNSNNNNSMTSSKKRASSSAAGTAEQLDHWHQQQAPYQPADNNQHAYSSANNQAVPGQPFVAEHTPLIAERTFSSSNSSPPLLPPNHLPPAQHQYTIHNQIAMSQYATLSMAHNLGQYQSRGGNVGSSYPLSASALPSEIGQQHRGAPDGSRYSKAAKHSHDDSSAAARAAADGMMAGSPQSISSISAHHHTAAAAAAAAGGYEQQQQQQQRGQGVLKEPDNFESPPQQDLVSSSTDAFVDWVPEGLPSAAVLADFFTSGSREQEYNTSPDSASSHRH